MGVSCGAVLCTLELRVITPEEYTIYYYSSIYYYKIPRDVVKFRLTLLWFTYLQFSMDNV